MKKKILITGINGFLGSNLAISLEKSYEVIGLEHSLDNLFRIESKNFKVYSTVKDSLETIFNENIFYAVLHVATIYRREEEPLADLLNTNVLLPIKLLELSNKFKVNLFLNTDSFFNDASYSYSYLSDYTLSKKHSLEWIKLISNLVTCKVVNMKVFHMYGDNDAPGKFIPSIIERLKSNVPSIDMTPGEQTRDFIYVKDVTSAFDFILNSFDTLQTYQEFEIGSGKSFSIKHVTELIKDITNSRTKLNFGAIDYRDGEIMNSNSNILGLLKLQWRPKYTIESGLKDYL